VDEELLTGGNTHAAVVRAGDTVRRPTGPWTPGVHALLRHLEERGFDGAPRVLGIDEQGREVLTFVPGDVVYPDHLDLVASDDALAAIARLIRRFHEAVSDFDPSGFEWSDRGADGRPGGELVCHNDLAVWNLVGRADGSWAFVDWDLAAPGERSWDVAWALLTLAPLAPDFDIPGADVPHRLRVFRDAYGELPPGVIDVAVARCEREASLIRSLGGRGDPAYARLLAEGHAEIWEAAATHVARHAPVWKEAL
jgi:hypothetical protein